jgi:hypothetical protein
MCTEVYFKHERTVAGSIAELAALVGGLEAIIFHKAEDGEVDDRAELIGDGDSCLCHVDIEATFAPTVWRLSEWEDGHDWTAHKPQWLIDDEQRAADKARYDAAMAEMRSTPPRDGEAGR